MSNTTTASMETNAKYSALDHGGLEAVERHDGPEVVPGSGAPLARSPSSEQPEAMHPAQYQPTHYETDKQAQGNFYTDSDASAPAYTDDRKPAYINHDAKEPQVETQQEHQPREARRYCGMRKPIFIAVIVGLVVVAIAAVLGGVLGWLSTQHSSSYPTSAAADTTNSTSLNTSSSTTGPLQAESNTGLATTIAADGSGRLLAYYQDSNGRIIENSYLNGSWTLEDSNKINDSVVTTGATVGSALAAISYAVNDTVVRQIFYIDATGTVQTTSSSTTSDSIASSWSAPVAVSSDTASAQSSVGLAACVDHVGMNGIRLFYGSSVVDAIQEVGWQFNDTGSGWTELDYFEDSDANSGVACVVYDNSAEGDEYINVYMRNTTTGAVQQNFWDYNYNDGWQLGPTGWSNMSILSGSDITAANDDTASEYVFFQISGGMITRGRVDPAGSDFDGFDIVQGGASGTKLASAFVEGGAFLVFQNSSSASTMWVSDESRTGASISNIAIP